MRAMPAIQHCSCCWHTPSPTACHPSRHPCRAARPRAAASPRSAAARAPRPPPAAAASARAPARAAAAPGDPRGASPHPLRAATPLLQPSAAAVLLPLTPMLDPPPLPASAQPQAPPLQEGGVPGGRVPRRPERPASLQRAQPHLPGAQGGRGLPQAGAPRCRSATSRRGWCLETACGHPAPALGAVPLTAPTSPSPLPAAGRRGALLPALRCGTPAGRV